MSNIIPCCGESLVDYGKLTWYGAELVIQSVMEPEFRVVDFLALLLDQVMRFLTLSLMLKLYLSKTT